jgi:molybdate transport system regulatory protein
MKLTVRLFSGSDEKSFGPGVAELLTRIERCQSLRMASEEMGMSYSKAWTKLGDCEEALGFPLLERAAGGRHGGSSHLTPKGQLLLERYRRLEEALADAGRRAQETFFSDF